MLERLLLITATGLEAIPFRAALTNLEQISFPLGELWRGLLPASGAYSNTPLQVHLANFGIGKVNTAAGLALAIEQLRPTSVIQFGIGGAYINSFASIGMVMAATHDVHIDSGVRTTEGWQGMAQVGFPLLTKHEETFYNIFPTDKALTQFFVNTLGLPTGIFATSETITGTFDESTAIQDQFDVSIESMEGAAAAQVCLAMGVPFAEVRSVSNIVGERDKRKWDIPRAVKRVNEVVLQTLAFTANLQQNERGRVGEGGG
jgi:futalosine hydrolase